MTGLERDAHKLKLASEFGADHTVVADKEDVVAAVMDLLPNGADIVPDTDAGILPSRSTTPSTSSPGRARSAWPG